MRQAIKIEPNPRRLQPINDAAAFAAEVVVMVICLACVALAYAAVTGKLDDLGRRLFTTIGI